MTGATQQGQPSAGPSPLVTYILMGGVGLSALGSGGSFVTLRDIGQGTQADMVQVAEMRGRLDGRIGALETRVSSLEETLEGRMVSIEAGMQRIEQRKQRSEDRLAGMIEALDKRLQVMGVTLVGKLDPPASAQPPPPQTIIVKPAE